MEYKSMEEAFNAGYEKAKQDMLNALNKDKKAYNKKEPEPDYLKGYTYKDYEEIPVDFETFLSNDWYLGKSTRNGHLIYPFWHNEAKKIFSRTDINEVVLTGSIGTGKSTAACLFLTYHLYKTMCLKDPQGFFGLPSGAKIVYAFLNNTVEFDIVQSFIRESPWFLEHGYLKGRGKQEYIPNKPFMFLVGSKAQHTLGYAVIAALVDETSFSTGQAKSKVMDIYRDIKRRMESRFLVEGKFYGMMFLVSSKTAFLEQYIADQTKKRYPIYVIDKPIWEIRPDVYSGETFRVAVGNKYLPSQVIKGHDKIADTRCETLKKQGLNIIDVPIEHMQAFDQDIDKALQDIAGISTKEE